jgi:translation initiation factor 2 alpha subunit (eIF-2alpha)
MNAKFRKGADLDVYITYLEDLRDHLEQMNWVVMETQFMVKVLNSLTLEYGTQVKLLEKRVNSGAEALTLEEIQEDLSLEYEHFQRTR